MSNSNGLYSSICVKQLSIKHLTILISINKKSYIFVHGRKGQNDECKFLKGVGSYYYLEICFTKFNKPS